MRCMISIVLEVTGNSTPNRYFRGHRFRGRVVAEFGPPIYPSRPVLEQYRDPVTKRRAVEQMTERIESGMRAVLVTATSHEELRLLHLARQLYLPPHQKLSTQETQDLNRRFVVGYARLSNSANGNPRRNEDVAEQSTLESMRKELVER